MAFDPLCGDGTAHAIREAILASAVIGAAARGDDPVQLLAHYEARLTAGFRRHLAHCLEYYTSGRTGPWWGQEVESVTRGLVWCDQRLGGGIARFGIGLMDSSFNRSVKRLRLYATHICNCVML